MTLRTTIREFQPSDAAELWQLFFDTVHTVNIRDYSQEQVDAWAPRDVDPQRWADSFQRKSVFVAERDTLLIGFGELSQSGGIDRFYCHADFLGQGVGSLLLQRIEAEARSQGLSELFSEVSKTSRPFFERRGFVLVREQQVKRRNVTMTNFVMTKMLAK